MTNRFRRRSLVHAGTGAAGVRRVAGAGIVVLLIAIFNGPVIFAAGHSQHATQAPRSQK